MVQDNNMAFAVYSTKIIVLAPSVSSMEEKECKIMSDTHDLSRRAFLRYTGLVTGAAATLGLTTASLAASNATSSAEADAHAEHAANPDKPLSRGWMFCNNALEFATLSAAAERIFPRDENGPGATDLAVPFFIDNQLAGAYGYNAREYIAGPHYFPGAPTQGYQTPLLRRDLFKQGLLALNNAAQERFGKDFPSLDDAEQDLVLTECEAGKLPTQGFGSDYFFSLLRAAVLAGVYADPLYNGNNNMDGWRLKKYPGAQMAYTYLIASDTFEDLDPISLSSMQ